MITYKKVTKTYQTEEPDIVICDRCGKNIEIQKGERFTFNTMFMKNTSIDESIGYQLCNDCSRELYLWLDYKKQNNKFYVMEMDYYLNKEDDFEID